MWMPPLMVAASWWMAFAHSFDTSLCLFYFSFFTYFRTMIGTLSRLFRRKAVWAHELQSLQSLSWCEIAALTVPPAEVKVTGPERKKLGKKPPRLCNLAVRALDWFGLMCVLVCTPGFFSALVQWFFSCLLIIIIIIQVLLIKSSVYPVLGSL